MSPNNLSISELQDLLMEETKKLTQAIRDRLPTTDREQLRQRIQEIHILLEERRAQDGAQAEGTLHESQ
jgi:hypothetical protein